MIYSKSKLLASLLCLFSVNLLAKEAVCPVDVQLTHYQPSLCYHHFDEQACTDVCRTADPEFDPQCFQTIELPCAVKKDLLNTASSKQQRGKYTWLHVSDVLEFVPMVSELHVMRQDLLDGLYGDYFNRPKDEHLFHSASRAVKKNNFKLSMWSNVDRLTRTLKQASMFGRLSLSRALKQDLDKQWKVYLKRVDTFPYYNKKEKQVLKKELASIKANKLKFWRSLNEFGEDFIAQDRIEQLNDGLDNLMTGLNLLSGKKYTYMLKKAERLNEYYSVNVRSCKDDKKLTCFDPITLNDMTHFYPKLDTKLNYFEEVLFLLSQETEALALSYDEQFNKGSSDTYFAPQYNNFIQKQMASFELSPSKERLVSLSNAIKLAYLNVDPNAEQLFNTLSKNTKKINGMSFITPYDETAPLLCSLYSHFYQKSDENINDIYDLMNDMDKWLTVSSQSIDKVSQLKMLDTMTLKLDAIRQSAKPSYPIDISQFDRYQKLLWILPYDIKVNGEPNNVDIEFIGFNNMYWTPAMGSSIQRALPEIESLSTTNGSLLPAGKGKMIGMHQIQMNVAQSPYTACHFNNQDINLIVSVKNEKGKKIRYTLIGKINKI